MTPGSTYRPAHLQPPCLGREPKLGLRHVHGLLGAIIYCGPKNMKPSIAYTLFKNLNDGDFVFVKPHDLSLFLFGREEHKVICGER
jgi:hypothetical protein